MTAPIRTGHEVETRTDRTDSPQLSRRPLRKFARHFEHEIPARRIPGKKDFLQLIALDQFAEHFPIIFRKARMAECRRQVFRSAAIPLIHPQNVESTLVGSLGNSQHIRRLARTLKTVNEYQCVMEAWTVLPVAFREKPSSRLDLE